MLLLKTSPSHLSGVFQNSKHAVDVLPRQVRRGDLLLIQQDGTRTTPPLVRYVMEFEAFYSDLSRESDKIWGRHWQYIIKGRNIYAVNPFNIKRYQVTNRNYGQGAILYAHVDPADEQHLIKSGMLEPL
jgi:5-methylcytosine-specific restriction enzyme A